MKLQIEIKQHHIDIGKRYSEMASPAAYAIAESLGRALKILEQDTPTGYWIRTGYYAVDWETAKEVYEFDTPPEYREFITRFDAGEPVTPITFILGDY